MPATKPTKRTKQAERNGETKHIRVMLSEADHQDFRVLAAQAGRSMFQHARAVLVEYIRAANQR